VIPVALDLGGALFAQKPRWHMTVPIRQQIPLPASSDAVCIADAPMAGHVTPDLPRGGAAQDAQLSIHDRGAVAVVSVRGDLDYLGASMLQAYLSGIRWQGRARSVADLTGLAFIDCACLSVLARHCKMVRGHGGSFALAAPQPAVHRILAVTGLLTWFEVHHTVAEAVASVSMQRTRADLATPGWRRINAATTARRRDGAPAPAWPKVRAARPIRGSWR
jgi:anti-anti-sigma factor